MGEARRKGQEGSRWYNERPDPKALAKWFDENVGIHEGLESKDYVQGITLIPATEKPKEVIGFDDDGNPMISQIEHMVYVPYAKVETRVKYFHDLMGIKGDDWLGIIEPVSPPDADKRLPPGFFTYLIPTTEGKGVRYVCCTMKVTVFKRDTVKFVEQVNRRTGEITMIREGETIIDAPPATKMVPVTMSGWGSNRGERTIVADDSAMMKAETGAVGRALGMAGMLVIAGSGVATAEDMNEALNSPDQTGTPELPPTPDEEPTAVLPADQPEAGPREIAALKEDATIAINALKNDFPNAFKLFQDWAAGRNVKELSSITDPAILRGLTAKAKRDYEDALAAKETAEKK